MNRQTRYELTNRIKLLQQCIDECLNWQHGDDMEKEIMAEYSIRAIVARNKAKRQLKFINAPPRKGEITPYMVDRARDYPITRLVPFVKGNSRAWCHPDKHPSLYHGTRKNVAVCPVCSRMFNPIDVLVTRDGMRFVDAVRVLNQ